MIYSAEQGKRGEVARLRTLESVWIRGKLTMWGRWSYIGGGSPGNMFNQLLSSKEVTKTAIRQILRQLDNAGLNEGELAEYFHNMLTGKNKSHLAFCTDTEALIIDRVIAQVLSPQQLNLIRRRYIGRGCSERQLAEELHLKHPELSSRTCRRRINIWLNMAEFMLYAPMCDAFEKNTEKFHLKCGPQYG